MMQNAHTTSRRSDGQQQQGGSQTRQFKPVRLPAVAGAVAASKSAKPAQSAPRKVPACLQDDVATD